MGYLPVFIMVAAMTVLWGLLVYNSLKQKKERVNSISERLAQFKDSAAGKEAVANELLETYQAAVRDYNRTVKEAQVRLWAKLFGFEPMA